MQTQAAAVAIVDEVKLLVRPMQMADIPQVSDIERETFPPPWPATNFRRDLTVNTSTSYLVASEEAYQEEMGPSNPGDRGGDPSSQGAILRALRATITLLAGGKPAPRAEAVPVFGFAGVWFLSDEAHIATIAVRSVFRRQGIGEHLLAGVIDIAIANSAQLVTLEVRASNEAAQALYDKYGFVVVGVRPGYYSDNKEDAILMTADGITSNSFQENFERLRQTGGRRPRPSPVT